MATVQVYDPAMCRDDDLCARRGAKQRERRGHSRRLVAEHSINDELLVH
jgi:hypothetical protein